LCRLLFVCCLRYLGSSKSSSDVSRSTLVGGCLIEQLSRRRIRN
jgi:hypothetical protein